MTGWFCLCCGALAALVSLNALRPVRGRFTGISFAGALLIAELGVLQAFACMLFAALFWRFGAAASTPGLVGLGLYAVGFVAAVVLELRAVSAGRIATGALGSLGALTFPARFGWRLRPVALSHHQVERVRDLSYGPAGARNLLDVYRPRDAGPPRPVLLQIHGGAWVFGSKNLQARPLLLHLAAAGYVCVAITYRLSPRSKWPAHLDDCRLALQWVREHIAEHGGDPSRIIVTGGSAGGHLAALLALTEPDGIAGCVPFYGPFDLAELFARAERSKMPRWICRSVFGCRFDDRKTLAAASPSSFVHEGAPPFFVIHGTADNLVPVVQARSFVEKLRAVSKQPVLYAELPGAVHAFDLFRSARTRATVAAVHAFAGWATARALPVADEADRPALR